MDWITGIMTVLGMELVARKRWEGWLVCLLNQFLWAYLIAAKELWELVPLTLILTIRYSSFMMAWVKQSRTT